MQRGGCGCSQPCAPGAPRGSWCCLSLYKRSQLSSRDRQSCSSGAGAMETGLGTAPALAVTPGTCGLAKPRLPALARGPGQLF